MVFENLPDQKFRLARIKIFSPDPCWKRINSHFQIFSWFVRERHDFTSTGLSERSTVVFNMGSVSPDLIHHHQIRVQVH